MPFLLYQCPFRYIFIANYATSPDAGYMEYIVKPLKADSLVVVSTDKEPNKTVGFMI